ncbi:RBP11-like subunits of RNA polymerase [Teratosphaeria nubilosa]|uniref:RBP11-like subunits of RNA polymerase n=1 Tax=Teratosphaeria nubilosa TaxID=161662 RepID=A0A6G1KX21_9PEZI|nr:RBP11-like subunits of RNA polymerase [Teratosphaeria nubilosa]
MNKPQFGTTQFGTSINSKGGKPPITSHYAGNLDPRLNGNVGTKIDTTVDEHASFESFLLGDGEKKVTFVPETRIANAAMFTFNKEDHTLGNLLRAKLVKNPKVVFAAYQVPHPLFSVFKLRVQTDGSVSPKDAVITACQEIIGELSQLDSEFTKEWELKKIAGAAVDV